MPRAQHLSRRVLRVLFPPGSLIGLAFFAGLFAWSLLNQAGFSAFGVRDESVEKLVFGTFLGHVIWTQVQILAGYLIIGYVCGALTGAFVTWAGIALKRPPGKWTRRGLVLFGVGALHLLLLARSIVEYPQLYSENLYDKGGLGASVQVWLTGLPLWLFDLVLALLGVLFILAAVGAAWRLGWFFRFRKWWAEATRRVRITTATIPAAIVAIALLWWVWPPSVRTEGPNVVIIAVDSLRADRLSAYGYKRKTPAIDRLAKEGTLFERAYVSLPRTFPSWTTLLTGQWPYHHGIRHMFPTQKERDRIPAALPKALARNGYKTSVIGDYAADIFTRIDYGFQRVDAPYFNFPMLVDLRSFEIHKHLLPYVANRVGRRVYPALQELAQNADPRELGDRALEEIEHLAGRGKFLLTIFFSAAHFPYAAPWPYYRLYTDPSYRRASRYQKLHRLGRDEKLTPADVAQIQGLYDGAVRSVDDQVARILAKLDSLKLSKNTYVLLLADHGEHLHAAGLGMGHGEHLRGDQALRIPLVVRGPDIPKGKRISALVRDADIAPTLYGRLAVKPASPVDGTDLWPLIGGTKKSLGLAAYAETGLWFVDDGQEFFQRQRIPYPALTQLGELDKRHEIVLRQRFRDLVQVAKHRMVQTERHRLVYIPTREGVKYEVYEVAGPGGLKALPKPPARLVRRLKDRLFKWMLGERGVYLRGDYLLPRAQGKAASRVALERSGRGGGG